MVLMENIKEIKYKEQTDENFANVLRVRSSNKIKIKYDISVLQKLCKIAQYNKDTFFKFSVCFCKQKNINFNLYAEQWVPNQ